MKSKRESVVRICKKEGFGGDCFPSLWLFSSAEESAGSRGTIFVFDFDLPKIREAKVASVKQRLIDGLEGLLVEAPSY